LINADYTIGVPLTWHNGHTSARLRIYHQSSHLGDEYLIRSNAERINLSFESLELLGAYDWNGWRFYFGGEYMFHREPADLEPAAMHGGVEFRSGFNLWGGHWVSGADIKRWEEHDWAVDMSVKSGLEFGSLEPGRRRLKVMLEYYDGYAPHGQFYEDKIDYYGIGFYLGF